ncbi:MAG: bifunctional riboflavin kinase/FAD synthetase [Desulfococcaceae bacterium]
MKVVHGLDSIDKPFTRAVLTIGNFDGVHLGHQALFNEVISRARAIDGTAAAMTFDPHPVRVLRNNGHPPLITLGEQKVELIRQTGLDALVVIPFTPEFAQISAREFLEDILIARLGMAEFVVGGDYAFGRNREGNIDFLREAADRLGFCLVVADWIQAPLEGAGRISSTRIRELVQDGEVREARRLLGRPYQVRGTVLHGRNRGGKLLGCPTANLALQDELAPKTGIYAVTVEYDGNLYPGVANIGWSPTFDDHQFTVEIHLLGFSGDLYDKKIRVNFVERIRDEKKFSGISELAGQIQRDIATARSILEN